MCVNLLKPRKAITVRRKDHASRHRLSIAVLALAVVLVRAYHRKATIIIPLRELNLKTRRLGAEFSSTATSSLGNPSFMKLQRRSILTN